MVVVSSLINRRGCIDEKVKDDLSSASLSSRGLGCLAFALVPILYFALPPLLNYYTNIYVRSESAIKQEVPSSFNRYK